MWCWKKRGVWGLVRIEVPAWCCWLVIAGLLWKCGCKNELSGFTWVLSTLRGNKTRVKAEAVLLTPWFCFREQRVTGIIVFILTGVSVFMAPILKVRTSPFLLPSAPTAGVGPQQLSGCSCATKKAHRGSAEKEMSENYWCGFTIFWELKYKPFGRKK